MKEYKLYLNGLNCANCGNKIEKKVNSLKEVQEAVLNFSVGTLTIELKNENPDLHFVMKKKGKEEYQIVLNKKISTIRTLEDLLSEKYLI